MTGKTYDSLINGLVVSRLNVVSNRSRLFFLIKDGAFLSLVSVVLIILSPWNIAYSQKLPSRPSAPCAGGLCVNGGYQNNGFNRSNGKRRIKDHDNDAVMGGADGRNAPARGAGGFLIR